MNLRKVSHISFLFSLAVLLLTFTSGSGSPRTRAARGESDEVDRQARDKTPASRIVWHYVGRATSNFANGTTVVVGYNHRRSVREIRGCPSHIVPNNARGWGLVAGLTVHLVRLAASGTSSGTPASRSKREEQNRQREKK